jgi:tRNA pseudouridine55 synthase
MDRPTPGLVFVHKPVGATSFSQVQALQAELAAVPGKAWKVCHGGTLDPFAEGLLPLLVGPATKLFERLHEVPKTYEATVRWGVETDTGDAGGRVVSQRDAAQLTPEVIEGALLGFIGWRAQTPPATSNKRVDGERAWQRAHRGESVELPPSNVYLHEARFLSHDLPERSRLHVVVRGGFYVRSLAQDLGRALGVGAHLEALVRVAIGPWRAPGAGARVSVHGADVLPWLERLELADDEWGQVKAQDGTVSVRGRPRPAVWRVPAGFPTPPPLLLGIHQRRVVALLERREGGVGVHTLLLPPL